MSYRQMLFAMSAAIGMLVAASAARAATEGWATGDVNLRTCGSTRCAKITTIPAGARVWVFNCAGWCELEFRGMRGFASARYISVGGGGFPVPPPVYLAPPPPPVYWYYGRPWWDDRYRSWHDGHGWWYDNRWHRRPPGSGFYFEFSF